MGAGAPASFETMTFISGETGHLKKGTPVRRINCWYDAEEKTWVATFDDPQLIDAGKKDFVLAWKDIYDDKKVLRTMKRDWKTHHVSLQMPKHKRHPALQT